MKRTPKNEGSAESISIVTDVTNGEGVTLPIPSELPEELMAPVIPTGVDTVGKEEAAPAPVPEEKVDVSTDFNAKIKDKSRAVDPFVPDMDQKVELGAKQVAATEGFELNRGTAAGARIIARSKMRHGK